MDRQIEDMSFALLLSFRSAFEGLHNSTWMSKQKQVFHEHLRPPGFSFSLAFGNRDSLMHMNK